MDSADPLAARIKEIAVRAGFARVGVAPAGRVNHAEGYETWLARGWHAGMSYMAADREKRLSPDGLVEGARSVICLAAPYAADGPCGSAFVARYARGRDYHNVLKRLCRAVMAEIRRIAPDFQGRAFVDSAPVMERSLAAAAGVGWIGHNGMLVVPGIGSYVLLAEIICNLPLPPDSPIGCDCRNCDACAKACPTAAIGSDGLVDARRCLSYLTIEHRGRIDPEFRPMLGPRVFGCDACQEACPHNAGPAPGLASLAGDGRAALELADVLAWTPEDWDAATRGSPMRRANHEMFLRNACLAAGNSGDSSLRQPLEELRTRCPQLAAEIDWALSRLERV